MGGLARNEFVRDGFVASGFEGGLARAKKIPEADGIDDTQCNDLLNVARRSQESFIVREGACGSEVEFIVKDLRDPSSHLRGFPKRKTRPEAGKLDQILKAGLRIR